MWPDSALGHHAEESAHDGAGRSGVADGILSSLARLVLEPLHGQVGDPQKRDEIERIRDGMLRHVLGYVHDFVHRLIVEERRPEGRLSAS